MNLAPSDLPRLAGAASLSKPGFDIVLAVCAARQAGLPTAGLLGARASQSRRADRSAARRALLCGYGEDSRGSGPRPARFFDLSDDETGLSETVNTAFTRGFQPMLNSSRIDSLSSDTPRSDAEHME